MAERPSLEAVRAQLTAPGAPFELETVEIAGRPATVWKNAPPDLRALFEGTRAQGLQLALVYEDERLTYGAQYSLVARLARALAEDHGVRKGDRVAIALRNYPEWPLAFWAATCLGAIAVPLNAWWTGEELEFALEDSAARVLVADGERLERLLPHLDGLTDLAAILAVRAPMALPERARPWEPLAASALAGEPLPTVPLSPEDPCTIFYSSGTTGRPKGVLGTHRNICSNLMAQSYHKARADLRSGRVPTHLLAEPPPPPVVLLSVPFFHVTGCHSTLVTTTAAGGTLVMMHKWNPERALELIERERLTSFGGVPSMLWQVLESPDFGRRDLSSVQAVGYGGAPAAPELIARIARALPLVNASNGYGLTETSSLSTANSGTDYRERPDSVGQPVAAVEVKIMDGESREVPVGQIGELWIRGPNVVAGYWNRPEATEKTFTEGWLHTGDVGKVDAEGFVYIVDRAKDMVIRGGENIYCVEVENALYAHPDVIDAAVVGVPHRILGEEVGAVVQLTEGSLATVEDIQAFVAARIARFKVPRHILIRREELPRNPNGKILKSDLRRLFV